ncbi:ABC transporter permease subunit [Devosia sp. UYZn731]|uniref:ABC transporter permease n=1 Tax=Devosia sp. UYZn731 TaxID=3156345 RepID=UPI0033939618
MTRSSSAGSRQFWRGALPVYLLFFVLIGLPLGLVLVQAIVPGLFNPRGMDFRLNPAALLQALASSRVAVSIVHSLQLAGAVAITATALGGAFAFLVQRCSLPWRGVIVSLPWLVFLTPSYLKALAWVLLMSPAGYLAQFGLLPPALGQAFFGLPGLVFVHTLGLFPMASFILGSALTGLGSEFEDAARVSGASPLGVWLRINGPLLAPALALSLIVIFAEVLSDFGMASTIARSSNFGVLTYGIYAAASDYPVDFPLAGSQALVLLLLVVVVVLADRLLRRQKDFRLISGRSKAARIYDLGAWRWPVAIAGLIVAVLALYGPLIAIIVRASSQTLGHGLAWDNLTTANLAQALSLGTAANAALGSSLVYAAITAVLACGTALLLAIRLEAIGGVLRPVVLGLSLGAVAVPGIVLGFGYILLWNQVPGFRDSVFPRYGDASLLVTGYVAAALPYCLIVILSAVGQLAPNLGDAARLQGVGGLGRILQITLPLVLLSVATAFLLTFIRTVFELPMSQMLIPQSGPAAPSMILKLFSHDRDGLASALALTAMVATGTIGGAAWLVLNRFAAFRRTSALPVERTAS